MLSCEGQEFLGMQSIMQKIAVGDSNLISFCQGLGANFSHNIQTMDVQPTADNGILITCTGEIKVLEEM